MKGMRTTEVEVEGHAPLTAGACRVIAECGANHNNSVERAIEMAERAAEAGAWAVKYQLYKADSISVSDSPKYWTDRLGTNTQHEAFTLSDKLDYSQFTDIAQACQDLGIIFFATPFDLDAVEALESMGTPVYKIASGDLTYKQLIRAVADTGKPLVLSTGAATVEEIEEAISWSGLGPDKLVLLVCTLTYPCPDEDANFARLEEFRTRFTPFLCGTSDHTLGTAGAWMTAALGGVCIEKHYTLDPHLPDVPDHAISVTPDELAEMVQACDRGAILRGEPWVGVRPSEAPARAYARRSIVLTRDVDTGTILKPEDLGIKRPGTGLPPSAIDSIIGRRALQDLKRGTVLTLELVE
jgi:sialic acid synthase SpsE